jgi:hypothetical protein
MKSHSTLPGFTGVDPINKNGSMERREPSVRLAGLWDTPSGQCIFTGTSTACTGLVLWCTDNFICGDKYTSRAPYPCGACVGVTNPSDW